MAAFVYILCFLTSLACAILLIRGYRKSGVRLLLWSGLCFVGLAINNAILFADMILFPNANLYWVRTLPALIGILLLIYGLVWEDQ